MVLYLRIPSHLIGRMVGAGLLFSMIPLFAQSPIDYTWAEMNWSTNSYYVQNRTNAPMDQRFWIEDSIYTCQVFAGEERVEMRWNTWVYQDREHLWEADVMFEPGTQKTCIMQIKSNEDGEPIYIQVTSNGNVRNDGDGTDIAKNMAGKWFNLKTAFDPVTGIGRAWIDDRLVKVRQYRLETSGWYFKNGTYNNGIPAGAKSVSHYKNIHMYIKKTEEELKDGPVFKFNNAYPNPFTQELNPAISFTLYQEADVNLSVYNLLGQKVAQVMNTHQEANEYHVIWETNAISPGLSAGIYVARLIAGSQSKMIKLIMIH